MRTYLIIGIIVAISLLIVFGTAILIARLKARKIDAAGIIDAASAEIPLLTQVINLLAAMLPEPIKTAAALVGGIIVKAINVAEQLKNADELPPDQRKSTALELISSGLKLEGITPDDKTTSIINDIVDIAARVLIPHSGASAVPAYTGQIIGTVDDTTASTDAADGTQTGADAAAEIKSDTSEQATAQ